MFRRVFGVVWLSRRGVGLAVRGYHQAHPLDRMGRCPVWAAGARRTVGQAHRQYLPAERPAPAANFLTTALTDLFERAVRRWYRFSTSGTCSRKACRQPSVGHTRRRTRGRTTTHRHEFYSLHVCHYLASCSGSVSLLSSDRCEADG